MALRFNAACVQVAVCGLFGLQMVMDATNPMQTFEQPEIHILEFTIDILEKMFQSAVRSTLFELKILSNLKLLSECVRMMIIPPGLLTPPAYGR